MGMYAPGEQDVQKLAPAIAWTVPVPHARQADSPVTLAKVPCTHLVQVLRPVVWPYEPLGQAWQAEREGPAVVAPNVPIGQEVHALAP